MRVSMRPSSGYELTRAVQQQGSMDSEVSIDPCTRVRSAATRPGRG